MRCCKGQGIWTGWATTVFVAAVAMLMYGSISVAQQLADTDSASETSRSSGIFENAWGDGSSTGERSTSRSTAKTASASETYDETSNNVTTGEIPDLTRMTMQPSLWGLTIDYRFRQLCQSAMSNEIGTATPPPTGYAPLSRLDYPLDSSWHGLQIGLQKPTWGIQFEWLTPQQNIQGSLADYDWDNKGGDYTDLSYIKERWTDGQMIDLGAEFRLTKTVLGLPIEFWPTGGFRWQRLDVMTYNVVNSETAAMRSIHPF